MLGSANCGTSYPIKTIAGRSAALVQALCSGRGSSGARKGPLCVAALKGPIAAPGSKTAAFQGCESWAWGRVVCWGGSLPCGRMRTTCGGAFTRDPRPAGYLGACRGSAVARIDFTGPTVLLSAGWRLSGAPAPAAARRLRPPGA